VAPFFDDFELEPIRLNEETIQLAWRQKDSDAYFDASSFSDGTLRFIALTTLILQPLEYRPSVLLIDEPELGLHPYAVNLLAALIKQESPRTQMIVSTQSPQFLDCFEPEDVVVAERKSGETTLMRQKTIDLKAWLEDYSLGDLWQKNQFGGQPTMD
jgi:predicted ATPase